MTRQRTMICAVLGGLLLLHVAHARTATENQSSLFARGYTVLPVPQEVTLAGGDFAFGPGWRLEIGAGVKATDTAVGALSEDLLSRFNFKIGRSGRAGVVRLSIRPGSVVIGKALDRDKNVLAEQAYRLELSPQSIQVIANAPQGLFYGVETLVQLIKKQGEKLLLPAGRITDWPDLQLRVIYWDDAHHLDRLEYLRHALRQAAFYKINGFAIKLEGHFQFKSAPAVVEPYALSPKELQELTDYGLRYHVQLIPYLDGPAHIAFILKHPEYAKLREYPESNYELCVTNPDSYKLLLGMFQDLMDANRGVKYIVLSTDEPYYVGMANNSQCQEALRAKELGGRGRLLAEFITKVSNSLHDRGRTVLFWGEMPLRPEDIPFLPPHLVNGETYGPKFDPVFKAHGIREMVYVSTEGEEPMFPDYYVLPASMRLHPSRGTSPRVQEAVAKISGDSARQQGDLMGTVVAGWADAGLHQETFWLGYATMPSAAWHPGTAKDLGLMESFYKLFYGPSAVQMDRVYELMSQQAQFWADSWETGPSKARKPILGYSQGMFDKPRPARDQSIPLPLPPAGKDLKYQSSWHKDNAQRLELVSRMMKENDELIGLLGQNLQRVEYNKYNLEVFQSIAGLYQQNLEMLSELGKIDRLFLEAQDAAAKGKAKSAIGAIDKALDAARNIRAQRNTALNKAVTVWYKTWFPRVAEANGRKFLHELDDIKDHRPDRTVDMSYLIYRELLLPMDDWYESVQQARNTYARANGLLPRQDKLDWKVVGASSSR